MKRTKQVCIDAGYHVELELGATQDIDVAGADDAEADYFVACWPTSYHEGEYFSGFGKSGFRSFCMDSSGKIRHKDVGGAKPTREALREWEVLSD